MMDTNKRLYELAKARDLSLYELSRKSGIAYSTLKNATSRGTQLTVPTIEQLCNGLGIRLFEFFEEDGV